MATAKTQPYPLILEWERRFPIRDWCHEGVWVWPVVRNRITALLEAAQRTPSPRASVSARVATWLRRWGHQALAHFRDRAANQPARPRTPSAAFFMHSMGRTLRMPDQRYLDSLFHGFSELAPRHGLRPLFLEFMAPGGYRTPRATPSTFLQFRLDAWYFLERLRLRLRGARPGHGPWPGYAEFLHEVSQHLGLDGRALAESPVRAEISVLDGVARRLARYLARQDVRIGFIYCYYNAYGFAFTLACRHLGIPCVDVQHGVLGEIPYGRWQGEARPRAAKVPFPDSFWVWSSHEKSLFDEWTEAFPGPITARVIGNPRLAVWQKFVRVPREEVLFPRDERHIAVSLQALPDAERDLRRLEETIRHSPPGWRWWLRLHPRMASRLEELEKRFGSLPGKIEVRRATELPLFELLVNSDLHLTRHSTVAVEAAELGVPSLLLSGEFVHVFQKQVDQGLVSVAPESLVDGIRARLAEKSASHGSIDELSMETFRAMDVAFRDELRERRIQLPAG